MGVDDAVMHCIMRGVLRLKRGHFVCELIVQVVTNCQVSGSVLGACRICLFTFFTFFGEEGSFQIPDLGSPDFYKADFLTFHPESGLAGQSASPELDPVPDFFSCFIQIFYVFPCIVENRPPYRGNNMTDENVSRQGSHERNGGVAETTISSAAIVSV
jgi:hypothetical protein